MASSRKIRSFAEYDRIRKEREEQFPQQVESQLEKLILKDFAIGNNFVGVRLQSFSAVLEILVHGPQLALQAQIQRRKQELQPLIEKTLLLAQFQENMHDLIRCGVYLSKTTNSAIPADEKQSFYSRFIDEIKQLTDYSAYRDFFNQYPDVSSLLRGFHYPQREDELDRLQSVLTGLRRKNYLTAENVQTIAGLLTRTLLVPTAAKSETFPVTSRVRGKTPPPVEEAAAERWTTPEKMDYLTIVFQLSTAVAKQYAERVSLHDIEELREKLFNLVGEDYARRLLQTNPAILLYSEEALLTKYLTTLTVVQQRLKHKNGQDLEAKFGIHVSFERYTSLEKILELKREVCRTTGLYTVPTAAEEEFDVEEYKVRLLVKANLDGGIVWALTHGKNAMFKGEAYMPAEYFRKNAHGKVSDQDLSEKFGETFEAMVRLGAITKKPKNTSPLYRLNPHFSKISNQYLREYMRLTLYAAQIMAQEGCITPSLDLDKE